MRVLASLTHLGQYSFDMRYATRLLHRELVNRSKRLAGKPQSDTLVDLQDLSQLFLVSFLYD